MIKKGYIPLHTYFICCIPTLIYKSAQIFHRSFSGTPVSPGGGYEEYLMIFITTTPNNQ